MIQMNVKLLIIVLALLTNFNSSTAQDTDLIEPSLILEELVCGDGICSDLESGKLCPEDCKHSEEIKLPEKEEGVKPEIKEKAVQESVEKPSFLSGWAFKIIIIILSLLIGSIGLAYFIYQRKVTTEPQKGIIEEQKTEETKTTTEEKTINPQLIEYIKTNIQKGFTKEQIKEALTKAGWNEQEIDAALIKF